MDNETLNLIISSKYLNQILSGEKKEEYRDVADRLLSQICILDKDGNAIDFKPIKYLMLFAGYRKDRVFAKVEVKCIEVAAYLDDKDNETDDEYFVFTLGKVVETNAIVNN